MNNVVLSLIAGASLALPAAAVDISKLPPVAKQEGVTYAKDIKSIFDTSCTRCHGGERHKGDLRLDSLEGALKGGEHGKAIVPGKSAESPLVIAVARLDEKHAMPPAPRPGRGPGQGGGQGGQGNGPGNSANAGGQGGQGGQRGRGQGGPAAKPLTADQVGLIRAWIDQGAK